MNITEANISACQDALYLLRQDVNLPKVETAAGNTTVEWSKCRRAFSTAVSEVWSAHDWNETLGLEGDALAAAPGDCTNWTAEMRNALVYCIARELAIPLAGRVQDLKNWDALYGEKLSAARAIALERELDAVKDPIHAAVLKLTLPSAQPHDRSMPRSIRRLTDRIDSELPAAMAEVFDSHDWTQVCHGTEAGSTDGWNAGMIDSLVHLIASKLAIPFGQKDGEAQAYYKLYSEKLALARVNALEKERDGVSDRLHKEILQMLLPTFLPQDATLPRSVKSIVERIETMKEAARIHVISDHAWNFARTKCPAVSCRVPHGVDHFPFAFELPGDCAHLEAVLSECGEMNEWRIYGRTICAMMPIRNIVYVRDMKKVEKWHPLIYRVFVMRLAADVSTTVAPDKTILMEQRFAQALSEAKCRDARESNSPTDAWGRNFYVDAMQGRRRLDQRPRLPRHSFHGLI